MTWTRLDDLWTEKPELADLPYPDRWHYLSMIQFCSRAKQYDGSIRGVDARRCSDHPNPADALANLMDAGLIQVTPKGYRLTEIDEHIPPPSVRDNSVRTKERMKRMRAHKGGNHSLCLPANCEHVTADVTGNPRTEQDDTGRATTQAGSEEGFVYVEDGVWAEAGTGVIPDDVPNPVMSWPVASIGQERAAS